MSDGNPELLSTSQVGAPSSLCGGPAWSWPELSGCKVGPGWGRAVRQGHHCPVSQGSRTPSIPLRVTNPTGTTVFSVNHLPGYGWLKMGTIENLAKLHMYCPHFPWTEEKFSAAASRDVTCSLVRSAPCHHRAPTGSTLAGRHTWPCEGTRSSPAHLALCGPTGEYCGCDIRGGEQRLPVWSSLGRRQSHPSAGLSWSLALCEFQMPARI